MQISQLHFQTNNGVSAQYTNVQVFDYGTNNPATIYNALTLTLISSIIQTDINGNIAFAAADGKYEVRSVTAGAAVTAYVTLLDATVVTAASHISSTGPSNVQADIDSIRTALGGAFISNLGPNPTTAQIQAILDSASYDTVVFDTDVLLTGNLLVSKGRVIVQKGCVVTLPDGYTVNYSKWPRTRDGTFGQSGRAVGLFHVDLANNTQGSMPGTQSVQIDIYGELVCGFLNGSRACGVFARRAQDAVVTCSGRIYGAWTPVFMCDSDRPVVGPANAYSDVRDTGSGPNAVFVAEGCIEPRAFDVWGVQYEEGIDFNANNTKPNVSNVETSGDYNICLEFSTTTGPGWIENEAVTQTTNATVITGYVTEWDIPHKRLYLKGTAGPWLLTSAVSNAGGSGTSGTPTRVSTSAVWYATKLVLSGIAGGTPAAGNAVSKSTSSGVVALWDSPNLWVKNVTGARFQTTADQAGTVTDGTWTATVDTVVDSFQSFNAMDISNTDCGVFTGIKAHNQIKALEGFNYPLYCLSLALAPGAVAVGVGATVTDGTTGATGVVLWYDATNRIIQLSSYNGTFANSHVVSDGIGGGGTIYSLTITLSAAPVPVAPSPGDIIQDDTTLAQGTVGGYSAGTRIIYLTSYTGSFGVAHNISNLTVPGTVGTSSSVSSAGGVDYINNGRSYSERFVGQQNIRNKGNIIEAVATYDQYWIGTGTLTSASPFDLKDVDDCQLNLRVEANNPTGDFSYFIKAEGGNRIGPPTDNTPPHMEKTVVRASVWSTKAPAFNTRDLITFNNVCGLELSPLVVSPVVSGKSQVNITRTGTNKFFSSAVVIDPFLVNASFLSTDPLPSPTGTTNITVSGPIGQFEIRGTKNYFNCAITETINANYVLSNLPGRKSFKDFNAPVAGSNVPAGTTRSVSGTFNQYSRAAGDFLYAAPIGWDLSDGAAANTITLDLKVFGVSDGNIRIDLDNRSVGNINVAAGAKIRVKREASLQINALTIPCTGVGATLPQIGELVTGTSTATGVVLFYEYITATTGNLHLGTLLVTPFVATDALTAPSGFSATAGTPVYNFT